MMLIQNWFKKGNRFYKFLIILFAVVLSFPLWTHYNFLLYRGDICFHVNRFFGTLQAFKSGQILPQLNPEGAMGLGFASQIFYGPLEAIFAAILLWITNSFYFTYNFLFSMFTAVAGLSMFFSLKGIFSQRRRFIAAIAYMCSPMLIWCLYENSDQGMLVGVALFPLVFCGIYRILHNKRFGVVILTISATVILNSHLLSALMCVIFALIYIILEIKKTSLQKWLKFIGSGILIIFLSGYYLLPLLKAKSLNIYRVFTDMTGTMGANPQRMNEERFFNPNTPAKYHIIMTLLESYWTLI
ncbi:MAG: YfhO family protein, partial [Candidatus Ancillula sp.]|nr:YfhO family protein [Candidatus Ancillula sp.]